MTQGDRAALRLDPPLGPGEPESGLEFRRLATMHTFGDSWTRVPQRGQLRIALNSGVTKDEIAEVFTHLEAYAGAARAFDSYQVAAAVFGEHP